MESKMQMAKVFEKTMLEKGTLICVRRKWLWFRKTIIQERLTNRMFILFITSTYIVIFWYFITKWFCTKGYYSFYVHGLNFNQQLINSEMKPQQLYPIIFQITRNKRFASCNINRNCARLHSMATKKIWCPECSP